MNGDPDEFEIDYLKRAYDRRAPEFESKYERADPVQRAELARLAEFVRDALRGRRVLEIACGSGYWTRCVAESARSVVGIDPAPRMLDLARARNLPGDVVEFRVGDAYRLHEIEGRFDAALAMFWLSHVPLSRLARFLDELRARLEPDSVVFMADDVYDPGTGGVLVRKPGIRDTFKRRTLRDGTEQVILKNYFDESALRGLFAVRAAELNVSVGRCFWWVRCVLRA